MSKRNKPTPYQEGMRWIAEARFAIKTARETDPLWEDLRAAALARSLLERLDDAAVNTESVETLAPQVAKAALLALEDFKAAEEISAGIATDDDGKIVFYARHIIECRKRCGTSYRIGKPFCPEFPENVSDDEIVKICEEWEDAKNREEETQCLPPI